MKIMIKYSIEQLMSDKSKMISEKLRNFKKKEDCSSLSDAINVLLIKNEIEDNKKNE